MTFDEFAWLIRWSSALLVGILLFSLAFFFFLRSRERVLSRQRVVFMDWDGVTSVAWIVTSASLLLVSLLTWLRIDGFGGFSLTDLMAFGEEAERRDRDVKDALWHLGVPILAALSIHVWVWAGTDRAKRRYRGPAKDSRWLLAPIAVTAGLLVIIGVVYRGAFVKRPDPNFDTDYFSPAESQYVAGPSFLISTDIVAPKTPVFTGRPVAVASPLQNSSKSSCEPGGFIAFSNPGRFPFERSAHRVN